MENNNNDKRRNNKAPKIKEIDGLNIAYDKEELKKFYPHLMSEISNKKKTINIDSVKMEIEQTNEKTTHNQNQYIPHELINPGAIDFIRRCSTKEEAFEILDYLLKKKEINLEEYKRYKDQIIQKGGLKKLIKESGGPKKPGYYMKKYYKTRIISQKSKSKKN